MSYNVVFEYTSASGGFAGIRIWTSYASKAEFARLSATDDTMLIKIAEDVSDKEAEWLTGETREKSRIKAAIEQAFQEDSFNANLFNQSYLPNALAAILHDRHSNNHGHYSQRSLVLSLGDTGTASNKEILFAAVDACSDSETGQVDLETLPLHLASAMLAILQNEIRKLGPDDGDELG